MLQSSGDSAGTSTSEPARKQLSSDFKPCHPARTRRSALAASIGTCRTKTSNNRHRLQGGGLTVSTGLEGGGTVVRSRAKWGSTTKGGERRTLSPSLSGQRRPTRRPSSTCALRVMPILLLVACWWTLFASISCSQNNNSTVYVLGASVSVGFGGGCPNACSGHGYCTEMSTETCTCHQGWAGGDCSIRLCPSGSAWVDHATSNNTAHGALTECSNMGVCDRATGLCLCRAGFTGEACQRMGCSNDCNGRGRCMSMREAAAVIDGNYLVSEGVYEEWDADMIHGCLCDEGWEGYDCSLRACPKGVDPYPEVAGMDEEQLIDCFCPGQCSGSLRLAFRGHSTRPIPFDSSAELVKYRLEELDTVDLVSINVTGPGNMICNGSEGVTTRVAFLLQHGSLSNMTADATALASTTNTPYIDVYAKGQASGLNPHLVSHAGTKEVQECSARGHCNRVTGHCMCYSKFRSSDGQGGEGDLGDCGYYDWYDPPQNCTTATPVWGSSAALCSGVGDCDQSTWRCNCTEGYAGGACERLACDTGVAWFEEASLNLTSMGEVGRTGLAVPCSAGGVCDESTGSCSCRSDMFTGDACEYMDCPTCNDVGLCKDMEYFAANAVGSGGAQPVYTYDLWDAHKMRSCWCNRSMSVGTAFSGVSTTYRGPYALSDTDSYGYDCSLARCPTGDNIHTTGVTEIQRVNCTGGAGVFTLSFRGETTAELDYYINAEDLESALEATPWILDVDVTFTDGTTSACNDTEYIDVEFLVENGDLPLIESGFAFLLLADGTTPGTVEVEEVQSGTREDIECAAHGICVEEEGVCDCFVGYQSSNGAGGSGERGDCGWRNKYQTALFSGDGIADDYN